ncbi:MAG: dipeptidase [Chloroflexi bacterium]|nr:dipeptidase [Chloroflexota bacterium]
MVTRIDALSYATQNIEKFISFLFEMIRIPSISTNVENCNDIQVCAQTLERHLISLGIENVSIFQTEKHPIIYGDYLHAGKNIKTVLVYGHYDVQPVDPLELWNHPPFEPFRMEDNLYARGSSDMKGQISACLSAIESILQTDAFPVNIKFLLEGEEEIGSPNLKKFLLDHKDLLAADIVLNPDTGMVSSETPTIVYGLRGLAYFEIRVFGPSHDLHSGIFGGAVHNPAQVLCDLISGMHDDNGKVTLPGFYDNVIPMTTLERNEMSRLNMDDSYYCSQTGVKALWGEKGYLPIERIGGRPTLEVNGFLSGYTSPGAKTIIPSRAMAKISTRLVPNQDPREILNQITSYFQKNAPPTVQWEVEQLSLGSPSISDIHLVETQALASALEMVWGVKPVYKREGGSVPVTADFQEILGVESVLTGFGLPDDNIHSPNEKIHLPTWHKGILALIHFFYNIAEYTKDN